MLDEVQETLVELIHEYEKDNLLMHNFRVFNNYCLPANVLRECNNVLSFGVHKDVKFEQAILSFKQDLNVHLFDPTPETVEFFKDTSIPYYDKLHYHPIAYGENNEITKFYYNKEKPAMFSLMPVWENSGSIDVETKNLETLINEYGGGKVDVVKADIEFGWVPMAKEILEKKLEFKILALEFEIYAPKDNLENNLVNLELYKSYISEFKAQGWTAYKNVSRRKAMSEVIFVK